MKRYVLAITGASGSAFGIRLLEHLLREAEVHLILSSQAVRIILHETGIDLSGKTAVETLKKVRSRFRTRSVFVYGEADLDAPPASGSFLHDGMLVVPCSMKTLAGIAHGYGNTLIERAADVTIKEGRRLLLSPREMPFSAIHLENMLTLARIGVVIAPPVPAFYHKPETLGDMIDFVTGKILDSFSVPHSLFHRWSGKTL